MAAKVLPISEVDSIRLFVKTEKERRTNIRDGPSDKSKCFEFYVENLPNDMGIGPSHFKDDKKPVNEDEVESYVTIGHEGIRRDPQCPGEYIRLPSCPEDKFIAITKFFKFIDKIDQMYIKAKQEQLGLRSPSFKPSVRPTNAGYETMEDGGPLYFRAKLTRFFNDENAMKNGKKPFPKPKWESSNYSTVFVNANLKVVPYKKAVSISKNSWISFILVFPSGYKGSETETLQWRIRRVEYIKEGTNPGFNVVPMGLSSDLYTKLEANAENMPPEYLAHLKRMKAMSGKELEVEASDDEGEESNENKTETNSETKLATANDNDENNRVTISEPVEATQVDSSYEDYEE